jgi:hypothetical protein
MGSFDETSGKTKRFLIESDNLQSYLVCHKVWLRVARDDASMR